MSEATAVPDDPMITQVVRSSAVTSFMRSAGTVLGREIDRSVLGTAKKRSR